MWTSGDGDDHIWGQDSSVRSFDTLGRNTKNSAHRLLVIVSIANIYIKIELRIFRGDFYELIATCPLVMLILISE